MAKSANAAKKSAAKTSSAKSEVVATPVITQKKAKPQKIKGPVPNYAKKARPPASSFLDFFKKFEEKQNVLGFNLFTGALGKYAVQIGEKKMIVQSFENEKGVQFECLETDFGFSTTSFVAENSVKSYLGENSIKIPFSKDFIPNFKLPLNMRDEQKYLHDFLRTAYEQTDEFKAKLAEKQVNPLLVTDTYKVKPLFSLVPKAPQPYNKWAGFAREERTCSDIRVLVMGRMKVYRIADEKGKYAVLTLSSRGDVVKVVQITLQYLEDGHELEGQLPTGTLVELHKLNKTSLGVPHGQFEQQQRNQGVLHAWLRKVASGAGIKPKSTLAKAA